MSVTDTASKKNSLDSLEGFDSELRYVWGPWIRRHGGDDNGLGFSRTNILHQSHGLGEGCDVDMPDDVARMDRAVRNLPNEVLRKVAKEWWVWNQCVSKQSVCRSMEGWYACRGVNRKVRGEHVDAWISQVVLCVWGQLGCPRVE